MYRELINKHKKPKKIVTVNADELGKGTKFYLTELNAGEKAQIFFVFENDLKDAGEVDRILYALNFMLCDKDGDRTERTDDYSYLCELPYPLMNRLFNKVIELLNISDELKKSAEAITSDSYHELLVNLV